jgi:hypothetical protein
MEVDKHLLLLHALLALVLVQHGIRNRAMQSLQLSGNPLLVCFESDYLIVMWRPPFIV